MGNLDTYLSALPDGLAALIVIVGGGLIATAGGIVVARGLKLFRFNRLCERLGVCDFLRKGEVERSPADLAGRGLCWIILLGAFLEAARLLDIEAAVEFRQRAVAAIPAYLSAGLVLTVGLVVVAFLATFVRTLARNAGSPYAGLWSRITRWAGATLVLAIAIEQAEIRGSALAGALYIAIAALALGMALAFGLGCKDMARDAMQRWIADIRERHREAGKPDMEG